MDILFLQGVVWGIILIIAGWSIGMLSMYNYMTERLKHFGLDWKELTKEVTEDELETIQNPGGVV